MLSYPTPNLLDTYTRLQAGAFDEHEFIGLSTVFLTFFGQTPTSETIYSPDASAIEIQLRRVDGEKRAKLRKRGTYADSVGSTQKQTDVQKFTADVKVYPLIEEEGDIHAQQLDERHFREPHYQPWTKTRRAQVRAAEIHKQHVLRIARTQEWLASQSILTGQQPIIEGASVTDDYYDFYRNSNMTVTLGTAWTGATDPIVDYDDAWVAMRQIGRATVTSNVTGLGSILGADSFEAFITNSVIENIADNQRLMRVEDNPGMRPPDVYQKYVDAGLTYQFKLTTYQGHVFHMFTYPDYYQLDAGTWTPWMPTDEVLVFNPLTRADRYFGPNERLPMDPAQRQLYQFWMGMDPMTVKPPANIKSWTSNFDPRMFHFDLQKKDRSLLIRTQCAPIYAPVHTDAYYVMKGVA